MTDAGYTLPVASITWEDGKPRSAEYGDIYWGGDNALDEKAYVFRDQHDLISRGKSADELTLLETGFGFGNNFLLTADRWLEAQPGARLHYIAIEHRPVSREDLCAYLAQFPASRMAGWLSERYPHALRSTFTLHHPEGISLHLAFEDIDTALAELDVGVDAWYLDGFSPSSNPGMWAPALYTQMKRLSRPGATASTYTVAGAVRRGLTDAGFNIEKRPGFGNKAEMLFAKAPGDWQGHRLARGQTVIVGAGVAGTSLKYSLGLRGIDATVIASGGGASHLPALNTYPQLTARAQDRSRLSLAASHFARWHTAGFSALPVHYKTTDADKRARAETIAAHFPETFIRVTDDAVVYEEAGFWSPGMESDIDAEVTSIAPSDGTWSLLDSDNNTIGVADTVILAEGYQLARRLTVPAVNMRGQAIVVAIRDAPAHITTGDIGITPFAPGLALVGSTYAVHETDTDLKADDTRWLLEQLALAGIEHEGVVAEHTGIRWASRDRLPIAGQMPDWTTLDSDSRLSRHPSVSYQPGLYVLGALGSRGATHGPLLADHVVAAVSGGTQTLARRQRESVAPERFRLRDARRRS